MNSDTPVYVKNLAKELRSFQTHAEEILWDELRNKKLNGLKFRRQYPIGRYIVDFYCPKMKLIIELDGRIHDNVNQKEYDLVRDSFLKSTGTKVLRISNDEILNDIFEVLKKITCS